MAYVLVTVSVGWLVVVGVLDNMLAWIKQVAEGGL